MVWRIARLSFGAKDARSDARVETRSLAPKALTSQSKIENYHYYTRCVTPKKAAVTAQKLLYHSSRFANQSIAPGKMSFRLHRATRLIVHDQQDGGG